LHGFEEGVAGIAVPLFDSSNEVAGSIAIASVASRINDELVLLIKRDLVKAAQSVSQSWGGAIPSKLEKIWAPYN
jgi:DNA-binding IclR family transcriptional regulator